MNNSRAQNLAGMGKRLVDGSLANFNGRDLCVAGVQRMTQRDLQIEKLHISASPIDRFGVVQANRQSVLTFGY